MATGVTGGRRRGVQLAAFPPDILAYHDDDVNVFLSCVRTIFPQLFFFRFFP